MYASLVLAVLLAASAFAAPQSLDLSSAGTRTETRHLTVTASTSAPGAAGRVELFLDVVPKPKMHVYAPEQKDVIPIALTLTPDPAVRAQPVKYPRVEKYFFAPLNETQLVYSKPFRLVVPIVLASPSADAQTVRGTLRYQACDDAICYLPQTLTVEWNVKVPRVP